MSRATADVLAVVGLIPLACAVYGGLLWALKIEGREELQALLRTNSAEESCAEI